MLAARSDRLNHFVELGFDLRFEVGLNLVDLGEFSERPTPVFARIVHSRHSVSVHRGLFFFGVFAEVALNFNNQMKQIVFAMPIVHKDNEVGSVFAILRAKPAGHFEAKVVILYVGFHPRMRGARQISKTLFAKERSEAT